LHNRYVYDECHYSVLIVFAFWTKCIIKGL
jgi:hypothetical protein